MSDQTPTPNYQAAVNLVKVGLLKMYAAERAMQEGEREFDASALTAIISEYARKGVDAALEGLMVMPTDETLWKVQPRCIESTLTGHQWWDGTCLICGGVERVVTQVHPGRQTDED